VREEETLGHGERPTRQPAVVPEVGAAPVSDRDSRDAAIQGDEGAESVLVITSGSRTLRLSDGGISDHGPAPRGPGRGDHRMEAAEQLGQETVVLDSQGTDTQTALVF
jgi:hypothetical protein